MSFDTTWDIEKYYNPHEPPEHWELRKTFIEVNKTKYPEQKLVSLAATFLNIEALGCAYSSKLMQLIAELSKGVVEGYRERKKQKLQKVFVSASDAAASKVKGLTKTPVTPVTPVRDVTDSSLPSDVSVIDISNEEPPAEPAHEDDECVIVLSDDSPESDEEFHIDQGSNNLKRKVTQNNVGPKQGKKLKKGQIMVSEDLSPSEIPKECWTRYGHMVLIEDHDVNVVPKQIIERSASLCRTKLIVREEQSQGSNATTVRVCIRETEVASATDMVKKKARELAYQLALQKLQEECFTVKIKRRRYDQIVGKNFGDPEVVETEETEKIDTPGVSASGGSIALKMMASMGWKGGGLGKEQQGITEPISLAARMNRSGLGIKPKEGKKDIAEKPETAFQKKAMAYLEAYATSESEQDLVFTREFTSDERKILHTLAAKFDLKSKSYGKQMNRHLVISRKIEPFRIVKTLLKPGYCSEKYDLLRPNCLQK